ncbi:C40 family peptidase [Methyloglobulus sp.]|uniref:C40 family peptidase n=1 Tax=Methyloglobulus sp. TaxID=2518622 RepID=UPI00398A2A5A
MSYHSLLFQSRFKAIARIVLALLIAALIGCASTPEIKPQIQTQQPLIGYALSLQGIPYRYGKETPEEGFDCSGFVKHVYGKQGVWLPRTTHEMASTLPSVPNYDLRSGDLVFFNVSGKTYSHVGIFINDDKFIHAPSQRTGRVLVSSMNNGYWRKRFVGARRPRTH